jgi:chloramphenicol 3-O phosphotransferase
VATQVIVLNGGSSSGKSGIARCLQAVLPDPWLVFTLEAAWIEGVAAMARAGARIIVDEAFLGGAASQQRWRQVLGTLAVLWVGVRCDGAVAAGREMARGDRVPGMAAAQAELVHQGVGYDLEVDTTHTEALECARAIAARAR